MGTTHSTFFSVPFSPLMAITHVHGPFFILLLIFHITNSSPDSDALLRLKRSFTNATALHSWKPGTEPCVHNHWLGVICHKGVVSGLRLNHLGLNGNIDVDALATISGLRSIDFMSNSFSGPIPSFNRLGNLRGLYITNNMFSGVIPSDYFSTMDGLRKIWLSGNNFWGPIPSSIVQLTHLIQLHMENNHFSGTIPPLQQTSLHSLDLSNNNLEGEIPSSLAKFGENSFRGNKGLCGVNVGMKCARLAVNSSSLYQTPKNAFQISMWVLLAFFLVLLMMIVAIYVMRRKQERFNAMVEENLDPSLRFSFSGKKEESGSGRGTGTARAGSSKKGVRDLVIMNYENGEFGLADLMKANAELLGNGALGSSYKATMANGLTVVVKRMKEMTTIGKEQFDAEMTRLGRLEHKNVLTPLAYHYRKDEKLLIYEYQAKGSLLIPLHGDQKTAHPELTWPIRLKIIQGIARGLGYLHTQLSSLDLPHGDLKSSNVLLTPNYEPLLTDYGYSSLISCNRAAQSLMGYKSPEAILDHNISPKCDVYCLGIIILEILTGKFPSQHATTGKGGSDIVQWAKLAISEGKEVDLLDPNIASDGKSVGEMVQLIHIGIACAESNPDKRLDIREAIRKIEEVRDCQGTNSSLWRDGYSDQPLSAVQAPEYNVHPGRRQDGIEES